MNENELHVRAQIRLDTTEEITEFIQILNSDGTTDKYTIEDGNGRHRINARSFIGVLYSSCDFSDGMFLVNESHDGCYPNGINKYRAIGTQV